MRFYLGGPINGCTDAEAHGWRDEVKGILAEHGQEWADPMDRDYRGRELEPGMAEEIVRGDRADIGASDVLLFNAPKPSWGTAMEILLGSQLRKPVIVVMPEGVAPSPWVVHHATTIMRGSMASVVRQILPGLLLRPLEPESGCGPHCNDYTGCDGGCRR